MMSGGSGSGSGSFEQRTKRRPPVPAPADQERQRKQLRLSVQQQQQDDGDTVPPVTVFLEGRCICHRVHLSRQSGYRSLATTLRRLFVDTDVVVDGGDAAEHGLDLSNAVPGHVVAYEDMEDDLLLAGDLSWKDFVRVAKRIRIIPAKPSNRRTAMKQCTGGEVKN